MGESENTKRIAKNTIMLYFRQILIIGISLYSVRVVLNVLGTSDYGIYNVVAGVVVLFSFLNNAMATATQRYLNASMGENNEDKITSVFTTSFLMHLVLGVFVVILSETVGLWFVKNKLNIPYERYDAALICYHLSIAITFVSIIRIPFYASVIAYEKMDFFAVISIIETVLKLVIIFLLKIINYDKLIIYSLLLFIVGVVVFSFYFMYCKKEFPLIRLEIRKTNRNLLKEITSFSGWTLLTGFADMCKSQGTNMIFNIFHGVTINAALGIANQVNTAIYQFISNFQTAYTPQVVKSYAAGDLTYFKKLVIQSMKISFVLFSIIIVPFLINSELVMTLWLDQIPDYTMEFVFLILLDSLVGTFIGPFASSMQAIGKIRTYQIVISLFIFLNLPFCLLLMYWGIDPKYVLILRILLSLFSLFWRVFYLKNKLNINPFNFIWNPILKSFILFVFSFVISYSLRILFLKINIIFAFFFSCLCSVIINLFLFYLFLFDKNDKQFCKRFIKEKLNRGKNE